MILTAFTSGLGNQLFIFAVSRMLQKKYAQSAIWEITNAKQWYALDQYNIDMSNIYVTEDRAALKRTYRLRYLFATGLDLINAMIERVFSRRARYFFERVIQRPANFCGFYLALDGYFPLHFNTRTTHIFMRGYFQSARYFDEIREDLCRELTVKTPPMEHNKKYIEQIDNSTSVCLHVRRGDYTSDGIRDEFLVCTPSYYLNAVAKMRLLVPNAKIFVFSDDIAWTRENIFCEDAVYIEERNPAYEELRLMCMCEHFIISNSSFSWWAQYLSQNPQKIVIAPDRWCNSDRKCDVWQDHWIRLPV